MSKYFEIYWKNVILSPKNKQIRHVKSIHSLRSWGRAPGMVEYSNEITPTYH